jgi:cell division septal protein FtsQ
MRRKFRTKEARKRERIRLTIKIAGIVLSLLLLFGLLAYGSHTDSFRIKHVHIHTPGILSEQEVASVVTATFEQDFFGVLPKDSVALIRHEYIAKQIKQTFPRVASVELDRIGLYSIAVDVDERIPAALWCGDVVPPVAQERDMSHPIEKATQEWGTCYLMDNNGYIYAKAPVYSDHVFPRYYGSLTNAEPVAQYYIDSNEFLKWQDFYLSLIHDDVYPLALLFVDKRDAEMYLSNGLKILVPRNEDISIIQNRLKAVLESGSIDEQKNVHYVDLRFGNKAFIKYVDEEVTEGN